MEQKIQNADFLALGHKCGDILFPAPVPHSIMSSCYGNPIRLACPIIQPVGIPDQVREWNNVCDWFNTAIQIESFHWSIRYRTLYNMRYCFLSGYSSDFPVLTVSECTYWQAKFAILSKWRWRNEKLYFGVCMSETTPKYKTTLVSSP